MKCFLLLDTSNNEGAVQKRTDFSFLYDSERNVFGKHIKGWRYSFLLEKRMIPFNMQCIKYHP